MLLNEKLTVLPESGLSVSKRVEEFLEENPSSTLIRLDQTLMNLPLPSLVSQGMQQAVEETAVPFGARLSGPWSGYETLKQAVSARLDSFGVKVPESDIFITGGLVSTFASLSELFAPENNVLLPSPCAPFLQQMQQCTGRNIGYFRANPGNDFAPEPDSAPADLIFLSSPNPVTGVCLSRENLQKWVSYANENGSIIFYDASLSDYVEGEEYVHSIYEIEGARSCAIELFSFEAGYGVNELKVGYVVIPASLSRQTFRIRDLFCARQPLFVSPPGFVLQKAAELLFSPQVKEEKEKLISRIKKVGQILSDGLSLGGFPHTGSENSPFLWVQCPDGLNSWQCFDKLLSHGLVVTPGSLFGYGGEGYFRMTSFGTPEEAMQAAEKLKVMFSLVSNEAIQKEEEAQVRARLFEEGEEI